MSNTFYPPPQEERKVLALESIASSLENLETISLRLMDVSCKMDKLDVAICNLKRHVPPGPG